MEIDGPFEANSWDVCPVEQSIGYDRQAEKEQSSGDNEEGGEVRASGAFGKEDIEGFEEGLLWPVSRPRMSGFRILGYLDVCDQVLILILILHLVAVSVLGVHIAAVAPHSCCLFGAGLKKMRSRWDSSRGVCF